MTTKDCRIEATVVMIDIRNFTPNLLESRVRKDGKPLFCNFLERFLNICLDCILHALPESKHANPPVYVNSTGDGILSVFYSDNHCVEAFLSGILIYNKLKPLCSTYNRQRSKKLPHVSFGIGIESGHVCKVNTSQKFKNHGLFVETYIGNAINIAARIEQVTKDLDRTNLIVSNTAHRLLCQQLFNIDYDQLAKKVMDARTSDKTRSATLSQMNEINNQMLLNFSHWHNLKGVKKSFPIYRLSETMSHVSSKKLLNFKRIYLTNNDLSHYNRIMAFLEK